MRIRTLIIPAAVVLTVLTITAPKLALAQTTPVAKNQILVTGIVPDKRVIVLADDHSIAQIFSNTDKNVTPSVVLGWIGGSQLPLTPALKRQYDDLLSQLRPNHIVTITADHTRLPDEYPNFVLSTTMSGYVVQPTAVRTDETAVSYVISSSNIQ